MNPRGVGASHVGKKRKNNEDAFHVDDELGLYVVSDGMGGHAAGEVAAIKTVKSMARFFASREKAVQGARAGLLADEDLRGLMIEAVQSSCRAVHGLAMSHPEYAGMGATLTAILVLGDKIVMGHVGDSRLYLVRQGDVHQLSTDHRVGDDLVRRGAITVEQASHVAFGRALSRSIGSQETVAVETLLLDSLPDDRFVLCTDGLSDYLEKDQDLAPHLDGELEQTGDRLVAYANACGGHDNITALVVQMDEEKNIGAMAAALSRMSQTRFLALRTSYLFREMPFSRLAFVFEIGSTQRVPAGELLCERGRDADAFYVVLVGNFVLETFTGVPQQLRFGDVVGETWMMQEREAPVSIRATENSQVLCIERAPFRHLLRRYPLLGVELLERMIARRETSG